MKSTAVLLDIKHLIAEQAWDNYEMASLAAHEFARMGYRAKSSKWDHAARASLDRHFAEVERRIGSLAPCVHVIGQRPTGKRNISRDSGSPRFPCGD